MRVVTLNTWKNEGNYAVRLTAMTGGLRALAPDVVLLQEVFRTVGDCEGEANTGRTLADALAMDLVSAPARTKARRWNGVDAPSESGLAVLARGRVDWHERVSLPSDDRGGERIALLVACEVRGTRVLIGCVHLSHVRGDDTRRREQLETVLAHPCWRTPHDVALLGGDCNATLDSPGLAWLAHHEPLVVRSVFAGRSVPPTFPLSPRTSPKFGVPASAGPGTRIIPPEGGAPNLGAPTTVARAARAIDHLFLVAPLAAELPRVLSAAVALNELIDGTYASDHAAVVADLESQTKPRTW